MPRLTDHFAKQAAAGERAVLHYDEELRGFGLRVGTGGTRSWFIELRQDGKAKRLTLGDFPAMKAAKARDMAQQHRAAGLNRVLAGEVRGARTLKDAWDELGATEWLPAVSPGTRRLLTIYWDTHFSPALGDERLIAITRERISAFLATKPDVTANRLHEALRRLLGLAVDAGWLERNAAVGWTRRAEHGREVYLSEAQLRALMGALPITAPGNALRLMALTGCRSGEAKGLRWADIDLTDGVWRKPSRSTKQRKAHTVPLSEAARVVIEAQPRRGDYVFSRDDGSPVADLRKTWKAAASRANLPTEVRPHDLRHSYASLLLARKRSIFEVQQLLGHASVGTTRRYSHLETGTLRDAADQVGGAVVDLGAERRKRA